MFVESEIGIGTSFFIFLPTIDQPVAGPALADGLYNGTGKILVMDNEEELLIVTGEALSALGYDITLARDGMEAIELYMNAREKDQPFHLVIIDLTVPVIYRYRNNVKIVPITPI